MKKDSGKNKSNPYVTSEYFRKVFVEDMDDLYQLSFLLTGGDHQKAEQCFIAGLEDSINTNGVFKEWARTWAKRTIIENAIRALEPRPQQHAMSSLPAHTAEIGARLPSIPDRDLAIRCVLALEDFERFVFVITVLERYSEHRCALLLSSSIRDVRNARIRATEHIAAAESRPIVAFHSSIRRGVAC
jgi:DNA-directed RNA polymerase specialized sigma24 family protein